MSGRYFEELQQGEVFDHATTRTITESDNVLFCAITMNPQPMHLDEEFAKKSQFGQRTVNGILTLATMLGITVPELTLRTTIAAAALEKVEFPTPVFHGDTIRVQSRVLSRRESRSRPDAGIVQFEHEAYNQRNETVAKCTRVALMMKRPKPA
jgi:acyl dehydratase